MVADVPERIQQSRNWFERAAAQVPGYRGYKERELRREADKLQREYVAERLEGARRRLEELQLALTRSGDLGLLGVIDAAGRKLRTVKDRWLFADYGYSGLFDTVKVDQAMLDQLYQYDVAAQEQAAAVEELVQVLSAESPSLRQDIILLEGRVDSLNEYFSKREHLITGVGQ